MATTYNSGSWTSGGTSYLIKWSSDGYTFFVQNTPNRQLLQYSVSVAWDISSTVTYEKTSTFSTDYAISGYGFAKNGTKLYISSSVSTGRLLEYDLTTAWDVGDHSLKTTISLPYYRDIYWNDTGTILLLNLQSKIVRYTPDTPWEIASLTLGTQSSSITSSHISINSTCTYALASANQNVIKYIFTTPWDPSTFTSTGEINLKLQEATSDNSWTITLLDAGTRYWIYTPDEYFYQFDVSPQYAIEERILPELQSQTSNHTNAAVASSLTLTKPTTPAIANGEFLIIFVGDDADGDTNNWVTPTGWIALAHAGTGVSDAHTQSFYRIATGHATYEAATIDVSHGGVSDELYGWYAHFKYVDAGDPINVIGSAAIGDTSPLTLGTLTTTQSHCLHLVQCAFDGGDGYPFTCGGHTIYQLQSGDAGGDASGFWGRVLGISAAGIAPSRDVDTTVDDGVAAIRFALNPTKTSHIIPSSGNLSLTSFISTITVTDFSTGTEFIPASGSLNLVGKIPTFEVSEIVASPDFEIPSQDLVLTKSTSALLHTTSEQFTIPSSTLDLTGSIPVIKATILIFSNPAKGDLTLTEFAPTVEQTKHHWLDLPAATLTLVGKDPTRYLENHHVLNPSYQTLILTGKDPTEIHTAYHFAIPPPQSLVLSGELLSVLATAFVTRTVPNADLSFSTFIPTLLQTTSETFEVPNADLSLTGNLAVALYKPNFYAATFDLTTHELLLQDIGLGTPTTTHANPIWVEDYLGTPQKFPADFPVWTACRVTLAGGVGSDVTHAYADDSSGRLLDIQPYLTPNGFEESSLTTPVSYTIAWSGDNQNTSGGWFAEGYYDGDDVTILSGGGVPFLYITNDNLILDDETNTISTPITIGPYEWAIAYGDGTMELNLNGVWHE